MNNNESTIIVNGVEYVRKGEAFEESDHVCVIADRGWIFEGHIDPEHDGNGIALTGASVVRKWSNGRGIGGLANAEYKDEYTLDYIGDIAVYEHAVLAVIPLRW